MTATAYTFGPFTLDPADRRLMRAGEPIDVSPRYFDALHLLATEQGRLVSKDRFLSEVWRGVPVTDEALTQCIRALRKALGDDAAAPRFIETVPRHGYRFVAPVSAATADETRLRTMAAPRSNWAGLARRGAEGALGGATAGVLAAMAYVMAGLVAPEIGAASTLLVLVSVNLLLGAVGGLAVSAGAATAVRWPGPSLALSVLGGAAGGGMIGALARTIGSDLMTLFFGAAPASMTGAAEGIVLGAFTGAAVWLARQRGAVTRVILGAPLLGAVAGTIIGMGGGRLMIGSLAALADRFAQTQLSIAPLSPMGLLLATAAECALFATCVALAAASFRGITKAER